MPREHAVPDKPMFKLKKTCLKSQCKKWTNCFSCYHNWIPMYTPCQTSIIIPHCLSSSAPLQLICTWYIYLFCVYVHVQGSYAPADPPQVKSDNANLGLCWKGKKTPHSGYPCLLCKSSYLPQYCGVCSVYSALQAESSSLSPAVKHQLLVFKSKICSICDLKWQMCRNPAALGPITWFVDVWQPAGLHQTSSTKTTPAALGLVCTAGGNFEFSESSDVLKPLHCFLVFKNTSNISKNVQRFRCLLTSLESSVLQWLHSSK